VAEHICQAAIPCGHFFCALLRALRGGCLLAFHNATRRATNATTTTTTREKHATPSSIASDTFRSRQEGTNRAGVSLH
jgi:hypothetical protein